MKQENIPTKGTAYPRIGSEAFPVVSQTRALNLNICQILSYAVVIFIYIFIYSSQLFPSLPRFVQFQELVLKLLV